MLQPRFAVSKNCISFLLTVALLWVGKVATAQRTTIYTEANAAYKHGVELFELGLYGPAKLELERAMKLLRPLSDNPYEQLQTKAQMLYSQAAVRMDLPDGERLVFDYIRDKQPEPDAVNAVLDMGNYFYNAKKYDEAINFYDMVDAGSMPQEQRSELKFKQGYAYFVKKKFPQAKQAFGSIKDVKNKYYYPTNYYYGMTAFFEGKYDDAIKSFKFISESQKYKPHVPYYISQIYFAQKKYDDLIAYATEQLEKPDIQKKKEIAQLLGQAYFEKGDYAKAIPHLETAQQGGNLRPEDYYQLGYAYYQTGNYKKAAPALENLNNTDTELGQTGLFLLGDSQVKNGDKVKARNAFAAAGRMTHSTKLQEEALLNYAKLSYELNNDQEAITAIQKIPKSSPNFNKGQQLLSDICLTSRDYVRAISILEQLPNKDAKMLETYQKVLSYRGIQLRNDKNLDEAERLFTRANDIGTHKPTKAISTFWLGDIAHQNKQYDKSSRYADQFLKLADQVDNLPNEASEYTGRYLQGYNYLKLEKYADAFTQFKECIAGIRKDRDYIGSDYITKEVYGDAVLRAGDCLFKRNNYKDALKYYDEAVTKKYSGFVYALYQKAMIQGLQGQNFEKTVSLDNIVNNYPKSEYTDDALWQLGVTYQELNRPGESIAPLKKLVNNFKGKSDMVNKALLRLGLITYNQGDNAGAISYYKQALQNNPTSIERKEAMSALEEIYVKDLGKPDEYFEVVENTTGTKVNEVAKDSINFNVAQAQYEGGNCEKAIEGYTTYLSKFSKGSNALQAYFNRAECYVEQKAFGKALADYESIIQRGQSSYYAKALDRAAVIQYNDKKDFAKAYDYYTKLEPIATTDEQRFTAQLGAMRAAYRVGNKAGVKEMAAKVTGSPRATKENQSTAYYYLGKINYDEKKYDEALTQLNKAAKLVNNEFAAEARYLIANIYYLQRELDIAEKLCLKANEDSAGYDYWIAKSVLLLADIYAEKGDVFNARAALEALIENFTKDKELVDIAKAKLAKLDREDSKPAANTTSRLKSDDLDLDEGNN